MKGRGKGEGEGNRIEWPAPATAAATTPRPIATPEASLLTSVSGYRVMCAGSGGQEVVTVTAPDGRICLCIALLPEGPRVEVHEQSLRSGTGGVLRLDCDPLQINAQRETTLRTGSLRQEVAGDVRTHADGVIGSDATLVAQSAAASSARVAIDAPTLFGLGVARRGRDGRGSAQSSSRG